MQQVDLFDLNNELVKTNYFTKVSVCAWCNKVMDMTVSDSNMVRHGICNECLKMHILNNKFEKFYQ